MKKNGNHIALLLLFIVVLPVITGCLTEIPFSVKTNSYNLVLSDKDTYKEIKIVMPDEVQFDSTVIENGTLEYQIENLSDNSANVIIYIGTDPGLNDSGESILAKGIASQDMESGSVTNENLINLLNNDELYLGIKCDEDAVVAITFNLRISGSYNIVQGLK